MEPEVGQRREKDSEISAAVRGKESGNVLDEDPPSGSHKLIGDAAELEEEAAALAGESSSASRDAEVLTREAAAEDVDGTKIGTCAPWCGTRSAGLSSSKPVPFDSSPDHATYVGVAGHVGPVGGEDSSAPLVGFALSGDAEACSLEAEVESSDAAER